MKRIDLICLLLFLLTCITVKSQVYYNGEKLSTSRLQGNKVGNIFGAYITVGLAPANSSKVVEGESADMVINETKPVFTIKFESKRDSIYAKSENMNSIVLVKLHKKSNSRRLRTGKYGLAAGVQTGIAQKDVIPVSIEEDEEEDGVFSIKPKEELEKGEYAFYYLGKDLNQTKVYDFSIKK